MRFPLPTHKLNVVGAFHHNCKKLACCASKLLLLILHLPSKIPMILWLFTIGVINEELKNVFQSTSTTSVSQTPSHQDARARADTLLSQLHKKPAALSEKHVRRRRKHTGKCREQETWL